MTGFPHLLMGRTVCRVDAGLFDVRCVQQAPTKLEANEHPATTSNHQRSDKQQTHQLPTKAGSEGLLAHDWFSPFVDGSHGLSISCPVVRFMCARLVD